MRSDLLGEQIKLAVDALPQNLPLMHSGQLKVLAVTSKERAPQAPQVPSIAELLVSENYVGISAPVGLPAAVGERISEAVRAVCLQPDVASALRQQGFVLKDIDPEAFARVVQQQFEGWRTVAAQTGATL